MKKLSFINYSLLTLVLLMFCGQASACRHKDNVSKAKDVVILFDNDVHCATNAYSQMASLRDEALSATPYVAVVSAGDFIQGASVGSISKGEYPVHILNAVPYDVVTLGNHEFDYGMQQLTKLTSILTAEVVVCNFSTTAGEMVFPSYTIKTYGGVKVAFVGVMTPTTYASSTPTFFTDSLGKLLYNFHKDDTYQLVQTAVDNARAEGADYVFVLSHLGDDTKESPSVGLIPATRGIDAVLDGHAHHVLDLRLPNADGDSIPLLSTGTAGQYLGRLTIHPKGTISHELLTTQSLPSAPRMQSVLDDIEQRLNAAINRKVGYNEQALSDKDAEGNRLVRNHETALADFISDAFRSVLHTQIGLIHGGGIRATLSQGDITIGQLATVSPFNNMAARVSATGQQIMDALEVSVARYPAENGDFHIFSGLRYTIDPSIPSPVIWDENNMFTGVGGTRRVIAVEVQDTLTGTWSAIDPQATYSIGGEDYVLLNQGASGMFKCAKPMPCELLKDIEVLSLYIHSMGDTIRAEQYPAVPVEPRFIVKEK